MDETEETFKVIVVGDGNVGKTCMLRRFVKGDFVEQYRKTIGAEFLEKDVFLRSSNTTVKLMLWDTAGQEVFNALTQSYYRGASAAILAYSTVDRDSFMNVAGWKQRVESVCGPITMVLCQTKVDLSHESVVTNEEAEQLATEIGAPLFRVSTKDDFNVTQLFEFTAQQCVEVEHVTRAGVSQEEPVQPGAADPHGPCDTVNGEGAGNAAKAQASPSVAAPTGQSAPPLTAHKVEHAAAAGTSPAAAPPASTQSKKVNLQEPEAHAKKKKKFKCALA